jgi:hypothetical protein
MELNLNVLLNNVIHETGSNDEEIKYCVTS